jgi:beta-galactosidase
MPDGLQDFRIKALKAMGSNAYRCSHNPPTPELLDACDRLGMLVIDENRLMGTTEHHLSETKRLILRDRNHPSIISWSIGNEEWGIENSVQGSRIAKTMENYVRTLDTTRPVTYAFSGGMGQGISATVELLGVNYIMNKNTDEHHKKFPAQPIWGTEEGSTVATRGEYVTDVQKHFRAAYDEPQREGFLSIEQGWKHYATRPYLGGMFIWTGFDYRGEPTPFGWPSVTSYFGMMDLCGFPKDDVWFLKAWWMNKPIVHLLPHWNWAGKEGQEIDVWAYSNCDEVELFLNKKSLGKKAMPGNAHLEWKVPYTPGTLEAVGYNKGIKITSDKVQTTSSATTIQLAANTGSIKANREDISVITIDVLDKSGFHVPVADNEISFSIKGPGKIIGVGNGQPTSLEKDVFLPTIEVVSIENLKEKIVADIASRPETSADYNDALWQRAFRDDRTQQFGDSVKALVYRGTFTMPELKGDETVTFFYNSIGREQSIYINGKEIGANLAQDQRGNEFRLSASQLRSGQNTLAIAATPILKKQPWDVINMDPGLVQILRPAEQWKRKLFNGLSQVILQATGEEGDIILTATSPGLKAQTIIIKSSKADLRPAVAE